MTDYKALWQQMCERCDELDKKLAQQETLAWTNKMSIDVPNQPLYTAPQRKPLTDEEILTYKYMIDWTAEWSYINFARAIEAAHNIKE